MKSENARRTPMYAGVYRRRSAWQNHPAAAAFGGGGQACCSQEKETGELLFSGEGNMFKIIFRRREHAHYCYHEKETGALIFQEN